MIRVSKFRVRSLDVDFNELSWRVEDTTEDVLDYAFQVFRSEAPAGPWDVLTPPFADRYLFYDRLNRPFHNARALHYLLRVTHRITGATTDIGPVIREPDADLIAVEIRRHMNLLFREFTGRRCWLLPVRTFGSRCSCWNSTLQKRTRSGCRTCYDTGFTRGYLSPVETFIQIDPGTNTLEQTTNVGAIHPANTTARMSVIGAVKPRDIIVEPENKRWRVTQVGQTEQGRSPIHYELQMHRIPEGDVEYAIELQLDQALRDTYLNPARNYTNPHNLEAFADGEIPEIPPFYPKTYQKKD